MCEYVLKEDGKMLMCAYTGKPCTLCVLGDGNTFMEAEKAAPKRKGNTSGGARMNNLKGIKPGDEVHVIDDKGNYETYLFLAKVKHAVLAMPFPWGKEDIKDALDTLIYDTDDGLGANLDVFPAKRCFARIEDAAAAIEGERGRKE